ncbi:MAG TPA: hypothetical protein VGA07_08140 [Anaerolineales bacterium]|jgi:hypothetical protein
MQSGITDEDIQTFLRVNRPRYPSSIDLMQAAVQLLWPHGPPTNAGHRVARLVLMQDHGTQSTTTN